MGMKKLLTFSFIISALLITGCSNKSIKSIETSYDEATYQKTMTKVQNNVNEIIGKEYKYVLDNMGNPYCTRYYIDNDKINNIDSIEELNGIDNIKLIYPKEIKGNNLEKSALYIYIKNGVVSEVQTNELDNNNEDHINSNINIIFDIYNEKSGLTLGKAKELRVEKYVGKDSDIFFKDICNVKTNFDIYNNKKDENIKGYILDEVNSSNSNIMIVNNNSSEIEDIKIVNIKDGLDLLQKLLIG